MTKTKACIPIPADISPGDAIKDTDGEESVVKYVLPEKLLCWNGCVFTYDGWHICREFGYAVKIIRKSTKKERVPSVSEVDPGHPRRQALRDSRPSEILSGIHRGLQALAVHLTAITKGFHGRH